MPHFLPDPLSLWRVPSLSTDEHDATHRTPVRISENTHSRTLVNKALAASVLATYVIVMYVTNRVGDPASLSSFYKKE
jgi:hypothetical protein